jgi:hypothetical protein
MNEFKIVIIKKKNRNITELMWEGLAGYLQHKMKPTIVIPYKIKVNHRQNTEDYTEFKPTTQVYRQKNGQVLTCDTNIKNWRNIAIIVLANKHDIQETFKKVVDNMNDYSSYFTKNFTIQIIGDKEQ